MLVYTVRPSGIYLRLSDYRIVPAKTAVRRFVSDLQGILAQGVFAQRDNKRFGFYDIEVDEDCFYIHVYHETRTVYLLARFLSRPVADPCPESALQLPQSVAVPA